jgi:hypothetical protein
MKEKANITPRVLSGGNVEYSTVDKGEVLKRLFEEKKDAEIRAEKGLPPKKKKKYVSPVLMLSLLKEKLQTETT